MGILTVMVLLGEKGNSPFSCLRFPSLAMFALVEPSMLTRRSKHAGFGRRKVDVKTSIRM